MKKLTFKEKFVNGVQKVWKKFRKKRIAVATVSAFLAFLTEVGVITAEIATQYSDAFASLALVLVLTGIFTSADKEDTK